MVQRQKEQQRKTSFSHVFSRRTPAMAIPAQAKSGNQRKRRTSLSPPEGSGKRRPLPAKEMEGGVGGVPRRRRTTPMQMMMITTKMANAAQMPHSHSQSKTSMNPVFNKPLRTPRKKGIRWNKIFNRVQGKHSGTPSTNNTPEGSSGGSGGGGSSGGGSSGGGSGGGSNGGPGGSGADGSTRSNREDVEPVPFTNRPPSDASTSGSSKSDSQVLGQITDILGFYGLDDLINLEKISTTPSSEGESTRRNSENQEASRKDEESTRRRDDDEDRPRTTRSSDDEERMTSKKSDEERDSPRPTRGGDDEEKRTSKKSDEEEDRPRPTRGGDDEERRTTKSSDKEDERPTKKESSDSEDSPKKTTKKKSSKDDEEEDDGGDDEEEDTPPKKSTKKSKSNDEEERKKVDGKMDFILLFQIHYLIIDWVSLTYHRRCKFIIRLRIVSVDF
jgi:hypothetical protein